MAKKEKKKRKPLNLLSKHSNTTKMIIQELNIAQENTVIITILLTSLETCMCQNCCTCQAPKARIPLTCRKKKRIKNKYDMS